jgi:Ca2+-binding RTX toxin-like protein
MLTITGTAKADKLTGTPGDEQILGLGGNDTLEGGGGLDELLGGNGNDTFRANGTSAEHFDGGSGKDTIIYASSAGDITWFDLGSGQGLDGLALGDTYKGIENATGGAGVDLIGGSKGANALSGGAGTDSLFGSGGKDQLSGGAEADDFVYLAVSDSGAGVAKRDVVRDFSQSQGDDLVIGLDGNSGTPGFQDLTYVGNGNFSAAGQVRWFYEGSHTVVEVNTAGSGGAEMQIELSGRVSLTSSDFVFES